MLGMDLCGGLSMAANKQAVGLASRNEVSCNDAHPTRAGLTYITSCTTTGWFQITGFHH
jgi:hypothetical protein